MASPPKAFDVALAEKLAQGLPEGIGPNSVTALRLLLGVLAALLFLHGSWLMNNLGVIVFIFGLLADHLDGEVARLRQSSSERGRMLDTLADMASLALLFLCMGAGQSATSLLPLLMGIFCAFMVIGIHVLMLLIAGQRRRAGMTERMRLLTGYEPDDVLYLLPLVTLTGQLESFLGLASIGLPVFLAALGWGFHKGQKQD